ncbi:hypothetical protein ACX40Y_01960 [Sphingomonas sp. RS6]
MTNKGDFGRGNAFRQTGRSTRSRLFPSASAVAIAVAALASQPLRAQTVQGEVITVPGTQRTLSNYSLLALAQADPFGITFPLDVTGGVVLGDNSTLTFKGTGVISGTATEQRVFTKLPVDPIGAQRFFSPLLTSATVTGARADGQNILLRNSGRLSIIATESADQAELDLDETTLPEGDFDATIESRIHAAATGLSDTGSGNSLSNTSRLTVSSDATAERRDMQITSLAFSDETQLLSASSRAIGLAGGTATRSIDNAAGAAIVANAAATADLLDLSVRGVDIVVPEHVARATALAAGIHGGFGDDTIRNLGTVLATAASTVEEIGVSLSANEFSPPSFEAPDEELSSRASAVALGLEGGLGSDLVQNNGLVQANAVAKHRATDVALSDGGISSDAIATLIDFAPQKDEPDEGAIARAIGISGGLAEPTGSDRLVNNGTVFGQAYADSKVVGVSIAAPINSLLGDPLGPVNTLTDMFGASLSDYSSAAAAYGFGIAGGGGDDQIIHNGAITVLGTALSSSTSVGADVLGWLADVGSGGEGEGEGGGGDEVEVSVGISVFNTSSGGLARSTGIAGDAGNDAILTGPASSIWSAAASEAKATTVSVALAIGEKELKADAVFLFSRTRASSEAYGIDGGSGSNSIVNRGAITALADAKARNTDVSASLDISETGLNATGDLIDAATEADAHAAAIRATSPSDIIDTAGPLTASATADVDTVGVDVGIGVSTEKGVTLSGSVLRANQTASAIATAVEQPLSQAGGPGATIGAGAMSASADANSSRTAVGVNVTYVAKGVDLAVPVLLVDNNANARASLVTTGAGDDWIASSDRLAADSTATASSTSVGVAIAAFDKGVGLGVSGVLADTQAIAWANPLSLGAGTDHARIDGELIGNASATADSIGATIGISGGADGVAIGAAVASQATNADAFATAVDAGAGNDAIGGAGSITAISLADASMVDAGVAVSGVSQGVSVSGVVASSDTNANTVARAVDLGAGDDSLAFLGSLNGIASSKVSSTSVTVGLSGSATGVSVGAALASINVDASADARAADGGDGDDELLVAGAVQAGATADAQSTGVNVGAGISGEGLAAGAAALLGDTKASASAAGLSGGGGGDSLDAQGPLLVASAADAGRTDIAIALSAAIGVGLNFTYVDASTVSQASAFGLSGDDAGTAGGDDWLFTRGTTNITATSDAQATSVAVSGSIGLGGGASLFNTATTAFASAFGQFGGAGQDQLINSGPMTVATAATAGGPTISVNLVGGSIGDANSFAQANAVGLSAGDGNDVILNSSTIQANASSEAEGKLINVNLTGAAVGDVGTVATALATGIDAGDGDDAIRSTGPVNAAAIASAPSANITVVLTGAAMPGSASAATADAVAIRAGDGADVMEIGGALGATAQSSAGGKGVAFALTGLAQSDGSLLASSNATAIDAGSGYDSADVSAVLTVMSGSTLSAKGFDIALAGVGMSETDLAATATSTGYRGSGGGHAMQFTGGGSVQSVATATIASTEVSLAGGAIAKPDLRTIATAVLVDTGDGADQLTSAGKTLVSATATSDAEALTVALVGIASAQTGAAAQAQATGLRSGAGDDGLANAGDLEILAQASASGKSQSITVAGAAEDSGQAAGGVRAMADAQGMNGGGGNDQLYQLAALTVRADARVQNSGMVLSVLGSADVSDQDLQLARATAVGIVGGEGNDDADLSGSTTVLANATGSAGVSNVSIFGLGKTDVGTTIEAISIGADGGAGADALLQRSDLTVRSTSIGGTGSTGFTLLGSNAADISTTVRALTLGMIGGGDDDRLINLGGITGSATATGRSLSSTTTVLGGLSGNADSLTIAETLAMDGGEGDDILYNAGTIDLVAISNGFAASRALTIVGGGNASAVSAGHAGSVGMAGGNGADMLLNDGSIRILGQTSLSASGKNTTILGTAPASAGLLATGLSIGLGGGDGNDHLVNGAAGDLSVEQVATLLLDNSSMAIAGQSAGNGFAAARVDARGLSGDGGDDLLENHGVTEVFGRAEIRGSGAAYSVAGDASNGGVITPVATATGLSGGTGNDTLFSENNLTVRSEAASIYNSSTFALVGASGVTTALGSAASAVGLDGGSGANHLMMRGRGNVLALASAALGSNTSVEIGRANGSTPTGATASAFGLTAGGDRDELTLDGTLDVGATAIAQFGQTRFTGVGASSGRSASLARAVTYGLAGFAGDNRFYAQGALTLRSTATATGAGAAGVNLGSTDTASEAVAETSGYALDGGNGEDFYALNAAILVALKAEAKSVNEATTSSIFSDGISRAEARTGFAGAILRDSTNSEIGFARTATLTASGDQQTREGLAWARATSQGTTLGIEVDARAAASASTAFDLSGFSLGGGFHGVGLNGNLTVSYSAGARAQAQAEGNSAISGEGRADASAALSSGIVTGLTSLAGRVTLTLAGSMTVRASPTIYADANATSAGIGAFDPDALSTASASSNSTSAIGIRLGGAADQVIVTGTLGVLAAPVAKADAFSRPAANGASRVDAFASATAFATNTEAIGIWGSNGANVIENRGDIIVAATPEAGATARAFGRGSDGDVTVSAIADASNTRATGIQTGGDADIIVNSGLISVTARPTAIIITETGATGTGETMAFKLRQATSTGIGISSGGGNDQIVNSGKIVLDSPRADDTGVRIAIDAGDGDDQVTLSGYAGGDILMGNGADSFTLQGGELSGRVSGGAGNDTLRLIGAGNFAGKFDGFENIVKSGAGTYSIGLWNGVGTTRVETGTLAILGQSLLGSGHALVTVIRADGSNGALAFGSNSAGSTLRGTLEVEATSGAYVNGTSWDVVTADSRFINNFEKVILPVSTALRSFSGGYASSKPGVLDRYRVSVSVLPTSGFAQGASARLYAQALDAATPAATGSVADTIAALQSLRTGRQVSTMLGQLASPAPIMAVASARTTFDNGLQLMAKRPALSRTGNGPTASAFLNFQGGAAVAPGQLSQWSATFTGSPGLQLGGGAGQILGQASGFDIARADGAVLGVGLVQQLGNSVDGATEGHSRSLMMAAHYRTPISPLADLSISAATGMSRFRSTSATSGRASDTVVQTGINYALSVDLDQAMYGSPSAPSLFTRLDWRRVDGNYAAVRRERAAGLIMDHASSEQMEATFGLRWSPSYRLATGGPRLSGRFQAGWVHDFGAGDRYRAYFADMPQLLLNLPTDTSGRDSFAYDVGADLVSDNGLRFGLSSAGRTGSGGALYERVTRLSFQLSF